MGNLCSCVGGGQDNGVTDASRFSRPRSRSRIPTNSGAAAGTFKSVDADGRNVPPIKRVSYVPRLDALHEEHSRQGGSVQLGPAMQAVLGLGGAAPRSAPKLLTGAASAGSIDSGTLWGSARAAASIHRDSLQLHRRDSSMSAQFPLVPAARSNSIDRRMSVASMHSEALAGTAGTGAGSGTGTGGAGTPYFGSRNPSERRMSTTATPLALSGHNSQVKQTDRLVIDQVKDNVFINQYLIIKDLGKGAHGTVKLVYNTEDDMLYAMKVVAHKSWPAHVSSYLGSGHLAQQQQQQQQQQRFSPQQLPQMPQQVPSNLSNRSSNMSSSISAHTSSSHSTSLNHPLYQRQHASAGAGTGPGDGMLMARGRTPSSTAIMVHVDGEDRRSSGSAHGGRSVSVAGSGYASSSGSGAGGGAGGAGGGGAYAPSRSSYMSPSASTPSLAIPVRRNASRLGPIPPPAAPSTGQAGIAPLERGPSSSHLLTKQQAQQAPTALDFSRNSSYVRGSPNSPQPRGSAPCSPAMPATGQQQAQQAQQQGANLPLASSISLSRNSSLPYYGGLPESPQNEPGTSAGAGAGARGPPSLAVGSIKPMSRSGSLPRAINGQPQLPHQQPQLCDSPTRKASMPELGQQPGVVPWGDQRLEPKASSVGDGSCNNYYSELPPPPTSSSSPPPPPSQQQHSAALSRLGSGAASASMRPPGLLTFPVGGSATQLASVGSPPGALLQRSRQPPRRVGSEAGLGHLDSGQQRAGPGGRLGAGGGWTQLGAQYSNEIMVMKELDHPNVVKLYEVIANPANRRVLMLMEYVEGGCVLQAAGSSASGRKEPIQEQVALRYFRDVLQGLDYLHFNSIVHGDLKPDNLLLTMSAKVKISDFGSARMCGPNELLVKSVGTPSFMAPEMCAGLPFNGFAGDIWALGVCLFMFLYGTMPFTGKNSYQVYEAVQKQELLFPKPKPGLEVSVDVKHLITRLLEKSPSERATLEEVMHHPWVTRGGTQPLPSCSDLHVMRVCEELRGRNTATATGVVVGSPEAGPGTDEQQQQQRTAHVSGGRGRARGIGQQAFVRVLEPPMDAHTAPMPTSLVAVTSPAQPSAKPAAAPATAPAGAEAAAAKPRPGRAPSGRGLPVGLPLMMKSALTGGVSSPARKGVVPLATETPSETLGGTSGTAQAAGQQTGGRASSQAVVAQACCSTSTPSTPCCMDCPGPSVWEEDMQELLELLPGAQERVYEDGQHLIKLDEPAEGLFLLLEGCCDLMRRAGQRKYVADEDFADVLVDDDDDDQRLSDELQAVGAAPHETEYSAHDIHVPGLEGVGLSAIMLSTALPGASERPSAFPLSPHAGRGGAGDDDGCGSGLFVLGERQETSMTGLAEEGSDGRDGGKEEEGADALAAASGWPVLQLGDVGFSERGTPLAAASGGGLSSTGGATGRTPPLPPSVSAPNAPSGRAAAVAGAACEDADVATTAAWMALRPDSLDSVPGLVSAPLAHLAQSLSLFSNLPDSTQHATSAYGGHGERPARLPTRGASCALPAPSRYSRYSTALQLGRTSQALDGGEGPGPTVSSVLSNFVATSMKLPDVVVHSGRIERAMVRSDSMQERMDNMLMRAKPFANTEVRQGAKHLVCRRGPGTVLGDVCLDGRKPRKSETAVVARGRVTALLIPHEIIHMHMSSATGHPVVRAALNRSANALLVQEAMERFVECESEVRFSRKVRDHAAAGLRFWLAADAQQQQQQQQRRQQSQLLPHRPSHDGLGRAAGGAGYAGSSRIGRRSRSGSPQLHYTSGDLGLFRRSEI